MELRVQLADARLLTPGRGLSPSGGGTLRAGWIRVGRRQWSSGRRPDMLAEVPVDGKENDGSCAQCRTCNSGWYNAECSQEDGDGTVDSNCKWGIDCAECW
jgi:hypothetical protein